MAAQLKEVELEQQALTWPERARAITIRDQQSYSAAANLLLDIASLEKEITAHHKPIKDAAFAAHKAAVAAEKRLLDPLVEAKGVVKRSIAAWDEEQERIRRDAERKAIAEARQRAEEEALALAIQAEEMGASEETVQEIISAPQPVVAPVVAPTYQKTSGISTRQNWKAECFDLKLLCRAIAEGKASVNLVQPDMVALNQMARAMKSTMNIPGVRAVPETVVAAGRR